MSGGCGEHAASYVSPLPSFPLPPQKKLISFLPVCQLSFIIISFIFKSLCGSTYAVFRQNITLAPLGQAPTESKQVNARPLHTIDTRK